MLLLNTITTMRTDLLLLGKFFNISSRAFFDVKCLHIKQWGWIIIDNKWNAISSRPNNLSILRNQSSGCQGTAGKKILNLGLRSENITQSNISGQKIRYAGYYSLVNQPTRIKLDIIQKASHSLVDPTQSEAV